MKILNYLVLDHLDVRKAPENRQKILKKRPAMPHAERVYYLVRFPGFIRGQ